MSASTHIPQEPLKNQQAIDQKQDRRLAEQETLLRQQTECLQNLRDHFLPAEEELRFKRFRKYVLGSVLKIVAGFVFICGLWDFMGWYIDRVESKLMAKRYATVAEKIYYDENNPRVALAFIDHAIEMQEGNPDYRFLRAYIQGMASVKTLLNLDRPYTRAELDAAHQAYADALFLEGLKPRRPQPYILEGQILEALKDCGRAEKALLKAIELDGKNDFAWIRLATLRMDSRNAAGAMEAIDKALSLNPRSKWALLWKGVLLNEQKEPAQARQCYANALALDPRFDLAWYNMGWTWITGKDKDYGKAREAVGNCLRFNPDYAPAYYAIGFFYGMEDNYPLAKVYLDKAVDTDPQYLTAYKWRGIVCGEMKDDAGALENFNQAIHLDPLNPALYEQRAKVRNRMNDVDGALKDLRFACERDPTSKLTAIYLGDLYAKTGNRDLALTYYGKALQIDPKHADAWAKKAQVHADSGERQAALESIENALANATYKAERFWLVKGGILEKFADAANALACYVKARTLDPACASAWRREAALEAAQGRAADAVKSLKRYLELNPADEKAKAELGAMGGTAK